MFDYLIVGQGIAGSVLAYTLLKEHKKVLVVNDESRFSASKVAAGIYNPVTGMRLAKTWQADEIFPFLHAFYSELETTLHEKLLHPCSVYRPYDSLVEQNDWIARTARPDLQAYIRTADPALIPENLIYHPLGGIETLQAGWLNTSLLLQACKQFFISKNAYFNKPFDYQQLALQSDAVNWEGRAFKKIIFCEGVYGIDNPFFAYLPFTPVKGELLTLHVEAALRHIVTQGVYLFETAPHTFKAGATYDWDHQDWQPSEAGKNELSEKINKLLRPSYQITAHEAGVRPATPDRHPFVGLHPQYEQLGIFNGLGSKGVSLAPWLAHKFLDFMEKGNPLPKDVHIERFYSLYPGK